MARIRSIKPSFYMDDRLAELSMAARFIFPGLWQQADRRGRLEYRPRRLKMNLLPYDDIAIEPLIDELEKGGYITKYEAEVAGKAIIVLQVNGFEEHQRINGDEAKTESIYPSQKEITQEIGKKQGRSREEAAKTPGKEGKGKEGKGIAAPASPEPQPSESRPVPPPGIVPASSLPAVGKNSGTELYRAIKESFDSQNLGPDGQPRAANYPKEAKAIDRLCTMIMNLSGAERSMEAARLLLETYKELTESSEKYWRDQPFTASRLSSSGVFDSVVKRARERWKARDAPDNLMEAFNEIQAKKESQA